MMALITSLNLPVVLLSEMPLWAKFVNFTIFVVGMGYVLYKPISQGLQTRLQSIQDDLQRASKERAAAEARMNELGERIGRLDQEIADIKAQAEHDAQAERERIEQSARDDAERLRAMARLEIEGAFKAARNQLKAYAASQAVEVAENLIRREMKDEDRERLVTNYVEHLERIN